MNEDPLLISPGTKVAALLEAYPQLETVLIELAPAFKNLRNPVLRRTVARVATLDRAAQIAGIPTLQMVARLRAEVGQQVPEVLGDPEAVGASCTHAGCCPSDTSEQQSCDWVDESRVAERIDADALLASGVSPLAKVLNAAKSLPVDAILVVTVAFRPIPLIETLQKQGYRVSWRRERDGGYQMFASRGPTP